jgi:hypothetical protein
VAGFISGDPGRPGPGRLPEAQEQHRRRVFARRADGSSLYRRFCGTSSDPAIGPASPNKHPPPGCADASASAAYSARHVRQDLPQRPGRSLASSTGTWTWRCPSGTGRPRRVVSEHRVMPIDSDTLSDGRCQGERAQCRRSGQPGDLLLSSQVPFRIRTFCTGLMQAETVSRIGHPSGNLHRAGHTGRSCAGMAPHLQDSR